MHRTLLSVPIALSVIALAACGGGEGLSKNDENAAVGAVLASRVGPDFGHLFPRSVGPYRACRIGPVGPRIFFAARCRTEARRASGGIEVTFRQIVQGQAHWWRWKMLGAGKVRYEGEGGSKFVPEYVS